ncbi:protein of unknown function DUF239 [Macleaya cordata]|uniref:Neprosin PEP catalytic domain-containing protein n=1 Tax=Macleaya cordata TaxID=56857 RepID=A0A200Q535_MACCD|nr:protein of unknown function DUF239 [Macleaya cordata]
MQISKEEDAELERQLKILNKFPVKTIHTEWGDIIDCIDIHKQPAFDHPSLKNHKIQVPTHILFSFFIEHEPSNFMFDGIECLEGTVPIRRTTKEDLIRAKSFSKTKNSATNEQKINSAYINGAYINLEDDDKRTKYFGASANITTYNPNVGEDQFSAAQIWIESSFRPTPFNSIQAGWIVAPPLYKDHLTRIFTYWTGTGSPVTGCYNTLCPGFVQVDRGLYPTLPIDHISTYGGIQYYVNIAVNQDKSSGDWWLSIAGTKNIGYWPKALFNSLGEGADSIKWGGSVSLSEEGISPPMGSGHFPDGHPKHSCYFTQIMYVNDHYELVNLGDTAYKEILCPRYGLTITGYVEEQGNTIEVGGPGGNCTR